MAEKYFRHVFAGLVLWNGEEPPRVIKCLIGGTQGDATALGKAATHGVGKPEG